MRVPVLEVDDIVIFDATCACLSVNNALSRFTDNYSPWELVEKKYLSTEGENGLVHVIRVSSPDIQPPKTVYIVMDWGNDENGEI